MSDYKKLQVIFQTLSDSNRLKILQMICDKECSVSDLVSATNLSQPLVSHHLRQLKEKEFLKTRRQGPFIYYSVRDERILYAINLFVEIFKGSSLLNNNFTEFCPNWIIKKYTK